MKQALVLCLIFGAPVMLGVVVASICYWFMGRYKCPECGSNKHKRAPLRTDPDADPFDAMVGWRGFICKECGNEYTTKPPAIMKGVPIIVGIVIFGTAFVLHASPEWKLTIFGYLLFVIGPAISIYGIVRLFKKNHS